VSGDYDGVSLSARSHLVVAPNTAGDRRKAVRQLASLASDAAALAEVLDMLGLTAKEWK
jgi:hypothetical protein